MNKLISVLVAGATLVAGIAAVPAEAQRRGGFISVQGPDGRGGTSLGWRGIIEGVTERPWAAAATRHGVQSSSSRIEGHGRISNRSICNGDVP